jgi:hypothetical protein
LDIRELRVHPRVDNGHGVALFLPRGNYAKVLARITNTEFDAFLRLLRGRR